MHFQATNQQITGLPERHTVESLSKEQVAASHRDQLVTEELRDSFGDWTDKDNHGHPKEIIVSDRTKID